MGKFCWASHDPSRASEAPAGPGARAVGASRRATFRLVRGLGAALTFATSLATAGCAEDLPAHVELRPAGVDVDIVVDVPTPDAYKFVGEVTGMAAAHDVDEAHAAAKNDLRNKAGALGATLVKIDEDTGDAIPLLGKTRVKLVGRAYKPID